MLQLVFHDETARFEIIDASLHSAGEEGRVGTAGLIARGAGKSLVRFGVHHRNRHRCHPRAAADGRGGGKAQNENNPYHARSPALRSAITQNKIFRLI